MKLQSIAPQNANPPAPLFNAAPGGGTEEFRATLQSAAKQAKNERNEAAQRPERPERSERPERPERSESAPPESASQEQAQTPDAAADVQTQDTPADQAASDEAQEEVVVAELDDEGGEAVPTAIGQELAQAAAVNLDLTPEVIPAPQETAQESDAVASPLALQQAKAAPVQAAVVPQPAQASVEVQKPAQPAPAAASNTAVPVSDTSLPSVEEPTLAKSEKPTDSTGTLRPIGQANAPLELPVSGTAGSSLTPERSSEQQVQAAPPPLPVAEVPEDDANVARVLRGLGSAVHQRGGTVSLRLQPPELGVVRIQMEVQQGVVSARLTTEQESVRSLLQHQLGQLRHTLERQGLSVERLEVQVQSPQPATNSAAQRELNHSGQDGRSRGSFQSGEQQQQQQQQRHQQAPRQFRELFDAVA